MADAAIGKKMKIENTYLVFGISQEGFTIEVIVRHVVGLDDNGIVAEFSNKRSGMVLGGSGAAGQQKEPQ